MTPRVAHVAVGRVGRPHGLAGEVRVDPQGGLPDGLAGYTRFVLEQGGELRTVEVEACRPHGKILLVKFAGVDTPEAARALTHGVLRVPREELPALEPGEYYHADLLGCRVVGEDGADLGRVADVFESGPHDVLVIRKGRREWMLPVLERWVPSIDVEAGVVVVRPPEGLFE